MIKMQHSNICRLCLFQTPKTFPLMKNNYHKMLEALTSIKLNISDEISAICLKCSLNLKLAYNIQQSILKADYKLKNSLLNIKKESGVIKTEDIKIHNEETVKTGSDVNVVQLCDSCMICDLILDKNLMNSHIKEHFDNDQFCDSCNQSFSNIQTYQRHYASTHPDPIHYHCDKCGVKFLYKSFYNEHVAKAHPQSSVVVELCKTTVRRSKKTQKSITEKVTAIQNKGISKELAVQLVSLSELRTVYKQKHPKKDPFSPYTCNICLKEFASKDRFRNHNHRRKPCPICKKEITADNFSKHIKTHTSGSQMCEQCGKTYTNSESLRGHIFYKHTKKHYECRECKITFNNRQGLNGHRKKLHNMGTGHICETCGRKFSFSYDLKKHIQMTHLKLRPYVCEFCKKGFSGLHAMKTHRRQHTNETPYRCEVCGDGFRQNVSLRAHRKSKHNIVEAVTCACNICGKGFSSLHAVKAHMRCH